eukprot:jgi/Ulvmu1/3525/UM163_0006.1
MKVDSVEFSLQVEDPEWNRGVFGDKAKPKALLIALSAPVFNNCEAREQLHDTLIQALNKQHRMLSEVSIRRIQRNNEKSDFWLCGAEGDLVSRATIQKWKVEAQDGGGPGAGGSPAIPVILREESMRGQPVTTVLPVRVNIGTAMQNETTGQAGVDTEIFSISEFIDNSITALMGVPEGHPRVVDVYVGREELKPRTDDLSGTRVPKVSTLSYIAIVDSGTGMKDFQSISNRGQVPKRSQEQMKQQYKTEDDMIHAELQRPFLTDEDLSAFGEGCTKVMSDLGTYMYIASRTAASHKVSETIIDQGMWKDRFQQTMLGTNREVLQPEENEEGPGFMPVSQWGKTELRKVPGVEHTAMLPRILSYAERVGCSEAKDGSTQGMHTFTAFILLKLHEQTAEKVMFHSFHKVCNTLKLIYYHFLGQSRNFYKTFNGRADEDTGQAVVPSKAKQPRGTLSKRNRTSVITRESLKLHVFFHDSAKSQPRRPWDLLPDEVIGGEPPPGGTTEQMRKEWDRVSPHLRKLMSFGPAARPAFRHRCLNDPPWPGWPERQVQTPDYGAACEDELSRSIRIVSMQAHRLAAEARLAPASNVAEPRSARFYNELRSFAFACTHGAWAEGHLPITALLQYVPQSPEYESIHGLLGFAGSTAKDKWQSHSRTRATGKDLREATRYSILPAKLDRMCVWWNGRLSAFSKVVLIGSNKPLVPLFKVTDETLKLIKKYFPSLYEILTKREASDKTKNKDEAKKVLKEANTVLTNASREHVIGHLTLSDWKFYSTGALDNDDTSPPAHKRQRTGEPEPKPTKSGAITSRFRSNTDSSSLARSAQKSKTKQTVEPKMLQRLQEEAQSYTRVYSSPSSRYTEPVLALHLMQLRGKTGDAELLRKRELQQLQGPSSCVETEMKWASFDAVVWLATCMQELDSQMELTNEIRPHQFNKYGLRVFRSCRHRYRNEVVEFTEGDLIKVSKTFKLCNAPHSNLVAHKREVWGVIQCFTEPTARSEAAESGRGAHRCVLFKRILMQGDQFKAEDADVLLSEPLHRVQADHLHNKSVMKHALAQSADKRGSKAAEEYKRYKREIQAHRPTGLRVSIWPKEGTRLEDVPNLLTYRNSSLEPLMFALVADAPQGTSEAHVAEFPGPPEHQAGASAGRPFVNTTVDFPLAGYEILVGLERYAQDQWEAMPCMESKQLLAKASTAIPHPCPKYFDPEPPENARVFRVHGLDQRLEPGKYRLVVHVRHTLLTGAPEQATRGQAAENLKSLQLKTVKVVSGVSGPMNGQMQTKPRLRLTSIDPPADTSASAIIPFSVAVGDPWRISCQELALLDAPKAAARAAAFEGEDEVYLGEPNPGVHLVIKALDKWGNQVRDEKRTRMFVAEHYGSEYWMVTEWPQRVAEKHRKSPPPVPFKITGVLHSRLKELEDRGAAPAGAQTVSAQDLVTQFLEKGSVLEPFTVDALPSGLQDAAARAEVLDSWLPQEGMQRTPVKLNLKLRDEVAASHELTHVTLAVRAGFARTVQMAAPLPDLNNGEAIPAGTALQLLDAAGFPATLARGNVAELTANMVRTIEEQLRGGGGGGVPLRYPVLAVVAEIPTAGPAADPPETVTLGSIPADAAVAAFTVDLRRSEVALAAALPLRRLALTADQWDTARANGGVRVSLIVVVMTRAVRAGEGRQQGQLEWQEVEGSRCEFPFFIRPSALPAVVEVTCAGQAVPLLMGQPEGSPLRWAPLRALPGHAMDGVRLRLQGEDGRPMDLLHGMWEIAVHPPEGREAARQAHVERLCLLNMHRKDEREERPDGGVPLPEVDLNVPELPPVVVTPDAQEAGVAVVTGVHAPFLAASGPWEYRVEVRSADGVAAAMPGGGVGTLVVEVQPGPPAQWGLTVLSRLPALPHPSKNPQAQGALLPVVVSGEPLELEVWLQDEAGNPTREPMPVGSSPQLFAQPVTGALVQMLSTDDPIIECHAAAIFAFDTLAEGSMRWDGAKHMHMVTGPILMCRDMVKVSEPDRAGLHNDSDGLAIQAELSMERGEIKSESGELTYFTFSPHAVVWVRPGRPVIATAKPVHRVILADCYFDCIPVPQLIVSLFDALGNPTPARKAVEISVKCRQGNEVFKSVKLTKLPLNSEAYKADNVDSLQVMTQSKVLTGVVPPAKAEPMQLFFEVKRTEENALPLHPPFAAQTEPLLIHAKRFEPMKELQLTVKTPTVLQTAEVNGAPVVTFQQIVYNGIRMWACAASATEAAAADVCVRPVYKSQSPEQTSVQQVLRNTVVRVVDDYLPAANSAADGGSQLRSYPEAPVVKQSHSQSDHQPLVKDLTKARIIKVEALFSMPQDTALAACAAAAQVPKALSATATVQLRVVPGALAVAAIRPADGSAPQAPEGFATFHRGAARDSTTMVLSATDACGNLLTKDLIEELPGAGSLRGFKSFSAHLEPENVMPGRAEKVPLRCTAASDRACTDAGLREHQLLLTLQPVPEAAPLPASPEDAPADPLAFQGPCQLCVAFIAPVLGVGPGGARAVEARQAELDGGRVMWVGVDVNLQQLQEQQKRRLEEWQKRVRAQEEQAQRVKAQLNSYNGSKLAVCQDLLSCLRLLLPEPAAGAGPEHPLASVRGFLLQGATLNTGSIWEVEEHLAAGRSRPDGELLLRQRLEHAIAQEGRSARLYCRVGRGASQGPDAAAATALRMFASINAETQPRGPPSGDPQLVLGFAAQCVSFNADEAVRFFHRARGTGDRAGDRTVQDNFVQRLLDLLSHNRGQKLGAVMVYGQAAQLRIHDVVKGKEYRGIDMYVQPVRNLMRMMERGGKGPRRLDPGVCHNGRVSEPPQDVTNNNGRRAGGSGTPLLPAYHLLRPSVHFLQIVHEWGLHQEMGLIFDVIRMEIAGELMFVDGGYADGVRLVNSVSRASGQGRGAEVLCIHDGAHFSRTGGGRVGGSAAWPQNDPNVTKIKLQGVCMPGRKPPFNAEADVHAFFTLRRLLNFPFTRECLLIQRGIEAYGQYFTIIQNARQRDDAAVAPPKLPPALEAVERCQQHLEPLTSAARALANFVVATDPSDAIDSATRFADIMDEARQSAPQHAQQAAPPGPPQPAAAETGGVFAGAASLPVAAAAGQRRQRGQAPQATRGGGGAGRAVRGGAGAGRAVRGGGGAGRAVRGGSGGQTYGDRRHGYGGGEYGDGRR